MENMLGNTLGTWWEPIGNFKRNTLGTRENHTHTHIHIKGKKKNKAPWVHAWWAFRLDAWKFSSQKSSSPFLAWAKIPLAKNTLPYLLASSLLVREWLWKSHLSACTCENVFLTLLELSLCLSQRKVWQTGRTSTLKLEKYCGPYTKKAQ